MTSRVDLPAAAVDREWVGAPFADDLYDAEVELPTPPASLVGGAQTTVDVLVANRGGRVWRWGADARPPVMLAYRWRRDGVDVADTGALRTALPLDVPPRATDLVPVHIVVPPEPGRYELEVQLVHEGVRRFGVSATATVEVRSLRRIAVVARPERLPELAEELALPPDVELVALLRDVADRNDYGDYRTVVGLRPYLLSGLPERGRLRTLGALLTRTAAVASSHGRWSQPGYGPLLELRRESDGLVVDSPNWAADSAFGREWAWSLRRRCSGASKGSRRWCARMRSPEEPACASEWCAARWVRWPAVGDASAGCPRREQPVTIFAMWFEVEDLC